MAPAKKKQRLSNGGAVDAADHAGSTSLVESTTATEQETAVQQRRSLFVRALPSTTTSESLTDLFSDSYPVKHAVAVIDPATKACRGYGFVTFADAEDAALAKKKFNGHVLDGRKLRMEIAEPRQRNGEGDTEGVTKRKEEPQQPPKLIVRNLPWSIKNGEQLSKLFMSYGKVKQAYIPKKGPGLMAGFGFVLMRGRKNAEKAVEGVNGKEVDGRTLAVDWAVDKGTYEGTSEEQPGLDQEDESAGADMQVASDVEASDGDKADTDADSENEDVEEDEQDAAALANEKQRSDKHDIEDDEDQQKHRTEDKSTTLFVRNLPFTCSDEDLEDHFAQFGSTRYARVVMDHATERSKGTGFVCFYNKEDVEACLRNAPIRSDATTQDKNSKGTKSAQGTHSILQNEYSDPTGQYTLDGRVLQVSRAVNKSDASRLTEEGVASRYKRDIDKRKLFLLSEGTISSKSKLWEQLSPSERAMREASAKQRKALIEGNPSLHLSLTRLSIRNIPRYIDSKELKALARDAVVGFASDVKAGSRQKLSKEELSRGGDEMQEAEQARKRAGKGVVKQTKVVFESTGGSKVSEDSGAGRSRGYGFIEYHTHRNALMGLRWLNGHAVEYKVKDGKGEVSREDVQDRKKRLIVEFAIENAQVVMRRKESEQKARARSQAVKQGRSNDEADASNETSKFKARGERLGRGKRKRDSDVSRAPKSITAQSDKANGDGKTLSDDKLAQRNRIIGKKRAMRKNRKDGK